MGRPAKTLTVNTADRLRLESIARSQSLPAGLVKRAQRVLRMADGESNTDVARRYRVSRPTVTLWRTRYRERGVSGLHNELKPGRPRSTSEEHVAQLIDTALRSKPKGKTHWSGRGLAIETGLSKTTVHRYLSLFGVQPHRSRSFKLSTDAFFIEKVRDIVGLYLNPPQNALVLCVDEKSQVQALERTQPLLPMGLGYVEGITQTTSAMARRRCLLRWTWPTAASSPSASDAIAIRSSSPSCVTSKPTCQNISMCT